MLTGSGIFQWRGKCQKNSSSSTELFYYYYYFCAARRDLKDSGAQTFLHGILRLKVIFVVFFRRLKLALLNVPFFFKRSFFCVFYFYFIFLKVFGLLKLFPDTVSLHSAVAYPQVCRVVLYLSLLKLLNLPVFTFYSNFSADCAETLLLSQLCLQQSMKEKVSFCRVTVSCCFEWLETTKYVSIHLSQEAAELLIILSCTKRIICQSSHDKLMFSIPKTPASDKTGRENSLAFSCILQKRCSVYETIKYPYVKLSVLRICIFFVMAHLS